MVFFLGGVNMKKRLITLICIFSILMNVSIMVLAFVIVTFSTGIKNDIYTLIAKRVGEPKIAFIGDSITKGGGIWSSRIGQFNFNVWNFGQSGFTTRQLRYLGNVVANAHSKYAFIMAGSNDKDKSINGAAISFTYYKEILDTLRKAGTEPIIQLTLYRKNDSNPKFIETLNQYLKEYAIEHKLTVIDLNPILCPNQSLLPEYTKDRLHLTEAAYKVWAKEIIKVMKMKNITIE